MRGPRRSGGESGSPGDGVGPLVECVCRTIGRDRDTKRWIAVVDGKVRKSRPLTVMDRKARLAALAAKAGRSDKNDDSIADEEDKKKALTFRNYVPKDSTLDASAVQQPTKRPRTTVEEPKSALELALQETKATEDSSGQSNNWSSVTHVTTKKVNWDLKRDIQAKMDKLERRTQRAIVDLLRERLEREATEDVGGLD